MCTIVEKFVNRINWHEDIDSLVNQIERYLLAFLYKSDTQSYYGLCERISKINPYVIQEVVDLLHAHELISDDIFAKSSQGIYEHVCNISSNNARTDIDIMKYSLLINDMNLFNSTYSVNTWFEEGKCIIDNNPYDIFDVLYKKAFNNNVLLFLRWLIWTHKLYDDKSISVLLYHSNFSVDPEGKIKKTFLELLDMFISNGFFISARYLSKKLGENEHIIRELDHTELDFKDAINSTQNAYEFKHICSLFRKYLLHKYEKIDAFSKWYETIISLSAAYCDWVKFIYWTDRIINGDFSVFNEISQESQLVNLSGDFTRSDGKRLDNAIYSLIVSGNKDIPVFLNVLGTFNIYNDLDNLQKKHDISLTIDNRETIIELKKSYKLKDIFYIYMHSFWRTTTFICDIFDIMIEEGYLNPSENFKSRSYIKNYSFIGRYTTIKLGNIKYNYLKFYNIRGVRKTSNMTRCILNPCKDSNKDITHAKNGCSTFKFSINKYEARSHILYIDFIETICINDVPNTIDSTRESTNFDYLYQLLNNNDVVSCTNIFYRMKRISLSKREQKLLNKALLDLIARESKCEQKKYLDLIYEYNSVTNHSYEYLFGVRYPNINEIRDDIQDIKEQFNEIFDKLIKKCSKEIIIYIYFNTVIKFIVEFDVLLIKLFGGNREIDLSGIKIWDQLSFLCHCKNFKINNRKFPILKFDNLLISSNYQIRYIPPASIFPGNEYIVQLFKYYPKRNIFEVGNIMKKTGNYEKEYFKYMPNTAFNKYLCRFKETPPREEVWDILSSDNVELEKINIRSYLNVMCNSFLYLNVSDYIDRLIKLKNNNHYRKGFCYYCDLKIILGEHMIEEAKAKFEKIINENINYAEYLFNNSFIKLLIPADEFTTKTHLK